MKVLVTLSLVGSEALRVVDVGQINKSFQNSPFIRQTEELGSWLVRGHLISFLTFTYCSTDL